MADVSLASVNPLANVKLGGMSTYGAIGLVVAIVVVILVLVGLLIWFFVQKRQYWIIIKVHRKIGNVPTLVATYSAKEVPFGLAGDKLWRVATGFFKIKSIKWLPVGKVQSAPREFWYTIREDGEWINFQMGDIDKISKEAGIIFTQEDMKLQRLATERLLEQRLMDKTFWQKWETTIMTLVVFLVVGVSMAIIFFQWSKLLDKMIPLVELLTKSLAMTEKACQVTYNATSNAYQGLIPVN